MLGPRGKTPGFRYSTLVTTAKEGRRAHGTRLPLVLLRNGLCGTDSALDSMDQPVTLSG